MKTKMKSYKDKIKTDFRNKMIPYKGFQYIYLQMILIYSVLKIKAIICKCFLKNVNILKKMKI